MCFQVIGASYRLTLMSSPHPLQMYEKYFTYGTLVTNEERLNFAKAPGKN